MRGSIGQNVKVMREMNTHVRLHLPPSEDMLWPSRVRRPAYTENTARMVGTLGKQISKSTDELEPCNCHRTCGSVSQSEACPTLPGKKWWGRGRGGKDRNTKLLNAFLLDPSCTPVGEEHTANHIPPPTPKFHSLISKHSIQKYRPNQIA